MSPSADELARWIREGEADPALRRLRVGRVDAWPLLRLSWASALGLLLVPAPRSGAGTALPRWRGLRHLPMLWWELLRTRGGVLAFHSANSRFLENAGELVAPHLFPVLKELSARHPVLVMEYGAQGKSPVRSFSAFSHGEALIWMASFLVRRLRLSPPGLGELRVALERMGVPAPQASQALENVAAAHVLAGWWERLLRFHRTGGVWMLCYYTRPGMALCAAARSVGIPCIDVQHGAQSSRHYAYCGFEGHAIQPYNTLPTAFWTWGAREAEWLKSWVGEGTSVQVVGYPTAKLPLAPVPAELPRERCALFTVDQRTEPAQVDAILAANPRWTWLIRLHPSMRTEAAEWQRRLGPGVWVEWPTKAALPTVLRNVDCHVTHYSGVVAEAALLGVFSIMTHPRSLEFYPELVRDGLAIFNENPHLDELMAQRKEESLLDPPDYLALWERTRMEDEFGL